MFTFIMSFKVEYPILQLGCSTYFTCFCDIVYDIFYTWLLYVMMCSYTTSRVLKIEMCGRPLAQNLEI